MVHSDVKVGLKFFVKIISIKEITENYFLKFAVELVYLNVEFAEEMAVKPLQGKDQMDQRKAIKKLAQHAEVIFWLLS